MLQPGAAIFVPDAADAFVLATYVSRADGQITATTVNGASVTRPDAEIMEADPKALEGAEDLTALNVLNEPSLMHALRVRHAQRLVYSCVGDVIISVNPFEPELLGSESFSDDVMQTYVRAGGSALKQLPPHVFGLAERGYRAMQARPRCSRPRSPAAPHAALAPPATV